MDKDETIKLLADNLLLMTQMFVATSSGMPKGPAMDENKIALEAAYEQGWRPKQMRKAA